MATLRGMALAGVGALALAACGEVAANQDPAEPAVEPAAQAAAAAQTAANPPATASAAAAVERIERGNLVIENVPDIPAEVSERLRTYQNVRGHGFQGFTADGGILISTRFGQVNQIHHVAEPMGARRQLTYFDEPVGGANIAPEGKTFLFAKDTGGDEFFQGHLFDLASGDIIRFTEEGTRNGSLNWTDDGDQVAWAQQRDGDTGSYIQIADPSDPDSRRTVLDAATGTSPLDWSDDEQTLLLQQYISITHSRLFTLDIASGDVLEINPDDQGTAYAGGEFVDTGAPDRTQILTITDMSSEFRNLAVIDINSGDMDFLTGDIDWDVSSFDLGPDGRTVAFTINEGGLGTIKFADIRTGEITDGPDLPVGIAGGVEWNADGSAIGFTFNAATSPSDAWTYELATGTLTRWTEAEVGGLNPDIFVEPELISYPGVEDLDIPAWVYRPAGDGPHPVIIDIHGGPESQERPYFSSTIQYWVNELGVAVIAPNVRGSAGYGKTYVAMDNGFNRKKSVGDIGSLLDWIEARPGEFDTDRIVVYGGSYGGYMVLASMVDYADRLAGGVNIVGISNFVTFLENTQDYRRDLRRPEYGDERLPEMRAFLEEISPLNHADKITKPLFIIQGLNDPRVPASEAEQILAAMRETGTEAWYLLAKDEGHGFRKKANRDYQRAAETLFFRDILDLDAGE